MKTKMDYFGLVLGILMLIVANDFLAIIVYQNYIIPLPKKDLILFITYAIGLGILPGISIIVHSARK